MDVGDRDSGVPAGATEALRRAGDRPYGSARTSPQRREIADAALDMGRAFTVQELLAAARSRGSRAGMATVYRAVAAMEEAGWLARVGVRGSRALYAVCSAADHHHHLVCTDCGAVLPTECPLEGAGGDALRAHGFAVTSHEVTLYGLCRACRGVAGAERGEA